ncbi:MAG TPA: trypsin-like peptidase domain-containing protein [Limnochordia bacterium]|nr:trypsin-like peptidase domain-containing protein [Limnochordia bacterium]HPU65620.1 trypsin-like peptidase domain-containing protein [Limnochordia bacterium]
MRKRIITIMLILAVVLSIGAAAQLLPNARLVAQEAPPAEVQTVVQTTPLPIVTDNPYIIADIAEVASPATVFISVVWPTETVDTYRRPFSTWDPFGSFFDFWFSDPFYRQPMERTPTSAGSGFIIDESGIVLTNQHVVGNKGEGQTITVVVDAPGLEREYEAEIIGSDYSLDLAVLRIINENGDVFPTLPLGDSDAARVGEWTIAIGNPYGRNFEHTVTVGVLSAKGREISIYDSETGVPKVYKNLMQTDAAINRGNSGGPLLNIKGEVIGINTAVHAQAQGIGFAIPINVAKEVLDELITTGGVSVPWLGIWYQNIDENIARQLRLPDDKGVLIVDVIKGSPAEEAGLKPWDVIRRIGDRDVFTTDDVADEISKHKTGDQLLLTVLRSGRTLIIEVTLGNKPASLR